MTDKPSAGAVRAANEIERRWFVEFMSTDKFIQIIDEQTGLPDLIEALERIRDKAGSHTVSDHIQGDPTDDPGFSGIYEVAVQALARIRRETP